MAERTRLALLLLIGASAAGDATMRLGVNTHFDQNWPRAALAQVGEARAVAIRDTVGWGKVERSAGRYDFTDGNSGYVAEACRRGIRVVAMVTPRSRLYEGGTTVATPAGRRAFGGFVRALVDRFPCVEAIEIGNEINDHSLTGPMLADMPGSYVAIVGAVRDGLTGGRRVALLAGSTLSVGTGFVGRLFSAGLGPLIDGVAVHPYLAVPEQLTWQLARLRAAMARAGGAKPIWATEFSLAYPAPGDAPPHALKMITLLSAAGVEEADWYALREESWYRNGGLFAGAARKPALDAFRTAAQRLLASGDAIRIDAGDPLTFIYRFGGGPAVMWGLDRPVRLPAAAKAFDSRGAPIPLPRMLGPDPVIVERFDGYTLGPTRVIADTLLGYGGTEWSWSVDRAGGTTPLRWIDWKWASYQGIEGTPWRALSKVVMLAPNPQAALVERYRVPRPVSGYVAGCFAARAGTSARVTVSAPGMQPVELAVTGPTTLSPHAVQLAAGQSVAIRYSSVAGSAVVRRRVQLLASADQPAPACLPASPSPAGAGDAERGD